MITAPSIHDPAGLRQWLTYVQANGYSVNDILQQTTEAKTGGKPLSRQTFYNVVNGKYDIMPWTRRELLGAIVRITAQSNAKERKLSTKR